VIVMLARMYNKTSTTSVVAVGERVYNKTPMVDHASTTTARCAMRPMPRPHEATA
jgi:hypothetical protein